MRIFSSPINHLVWYVHLQGRHTWCSCNNTRLIKHVITELVRGQKHRYSCKLIIPTVTVTSQHQVDVVAHWFLHIDCREGGGVGDASIRKIAYFDGAKDPSLFKGNVRAYSLSFSHARTHTSPVYTCTLLFLLSYPPSYTCTCKLSPASIIIIHTLSLPLSSEAWQDSCSNISLS